MQRRLRLRHESQHGDHRHDVETIIAERQALGIRQEKADSSTALGRLCGGAADHSWIDVAADDRRCAPVPERQRERTVAAAHIQNASIPDLADQPRDQPPFEFLGDGAKPVRAPFPVGVGTELAEQSGRARLGRHRGIRPQSVTGQAFETVTVMTT
jgi:hypothetical protein